VLFRRKASIERNSSESEEELRASLVEHLDELRDRIIRMIVAVTLAWVVGWYLQPYVYVHLNALVLRNIDLPADKFKEVFNNATQPFMLKFKLSFMLGLIMAFPYLVIQLWGFIEPGLKSNERRPARQLAPFTVLLFAIGVAFCWIILPSAFRWFVGYLSEFPGTAIYQEPGTMVFFVLKMLLAFGMGFQLPLIVFLLGKIGLLTPETLTTYWRQATVFIFVSSAVITPSNDIFSMLMMAIPLSLLFIISIWAVKLTNRKKKKKDQEEP
jgi:sec-independent protein translocase protein TatC